MLAVVAGVVYVLPSLSVMTARSWYSPSLSVVVFIEHAYSDPLTGVVCVGQALLQALVPAAATCSSQLSTVVGLASAVPVMVAVLLMNGATETVPSTVVFWIESVTGEVLVALPAQSAIAA